jgi:hypothetical protein
MKGKTVWTLCVKMMDFEKYLVDNSLAPKDRATIYESFLIMLNYCQPMQTGKNL